MRLSNAVRVAQKLADEDRRSYGVWRQDGKFFVIPRPEKKADAELVETVTPTKLPVKALRAH